MSLPHKEPSRPTHATHAAHASQAAAHSASGPNPYAHSPLQLAQDARIAQLRAAADAAAATPARAPSTQGGLPEGLRSGIEALSGMDMSGVRVHRNSGKPAQLNAHAYAQGQDIHLAPGQEQHLPHEAWHVVQQAQGRVRPTFQMKGGVGVNDDVGLEREADLMGGRAVAGGAQATAQMVKHGTVSGGQKARTDPVAEPLLSAEDAKDAKDAKDEEDEVIKSSVLYEEDEVTKSSVLYEEDEEDEEDEEEKFMKYWVSYYEEMGVQTYDNFTGYKASQGTTWNTGTNGFDWSGCYIATSIDQAEGYISDYGSGKVSMWEISLKKPLNVKVFTGGLLDQPDIRGDLKARVLKKALKFTDSNKLIEELGKEKYAYFGPAGEAGDELVVPWDLVSDYIEYKRIRNYEINKHLEVTRVENLA